jgi:predicted O-methyltransferase YrrM
MPLATLDDLALKHHTDKSSAHHDYCRTYARYFERLRFLPVRLLELGVYYGASLRMWSDYFQQGTITGVDLDDQMRFIAPTLESRVTLIEGDCTKVEVLKFLRSRGPFDIIIDDASHNSWSQAFTMRTLLEAVAPGGFYVIEDTACAYWAEYQAPAHGKEHEGSMSQHLRHAINELIDYTNRLGMRIHGEARAEANFASYEGIDPLMLRIDSVHVHNSLLLVEMRP